MASKQEYLAKAKDLKKQIDSGRLKGEKLRLAKKKYHMANFQARHFGESRKTSKKRVSKRAPKSQVVQGQGFLPNFLEGESVVKLQEMIQQRIFKAAEATIKREIEAIETGLGVSVETKKAKKA